MGSEKVTGGSVWCPSVLCPRCRPQSIAVVLFNSAALSSMGQLSARYFPAANLFLTREKRYPGPASSMSQPDRVLPSLVNCTASGAGLLGPSVSWKRANNDPTPPFSDFCEISGIFQRILCCSAFHAAGGKTACSFETPPSTGTRNCTLFRAIAVVMASPLYL